MKDRSYFQWDVGRRPGRSAARRIEGVCLFACMALVAGARADRAAFPSERFQTGSGRVDLDGDGIEDCWRLDYEGGSGYGWSTLQVRAPCSAPVSKIEIGGSFGMFISVGSLPPTFAQRTRLRNGVFDRWFGRNAQRTHANIDGSLSWVIEVVSTPIPQTHSGWNQGRPYTPHWNTGEPALPPTQIVPLVTQKERRLAQALHRALALDHDSWVPGPALLVYYAENHHRIREAARTERWAVYLTDHAVAVRDLRRHVWSWAYVETGQDKLRHACLEKAATAGSLIVVEGNCSLGDHGAKLIVIDPQSGRWLWRQDELGQGWSFEQGGLRLGSLLFSNSDLQRLLRGSPG